jgi:amino acid permease
MNADWGSFLSRDDLLGGLPARRASTLLFAIESRTAQFVARSRTAMATYLTERTAEEQEHAFFEALAEGRDLPIQPTVQDLERFAPEWASLVPPDTGVRTALSRLIGEKYLLPESRVPGIVAAVGLRDPVVGERFQQLHGRPLSSIYVSALPIRERVKWMTASLSTRLENLPPLWTAFALTLTETVGSGILALPIAFATVGPVAGVVALVMLGLVNLLTIAAMAEAVARNGNVRFGRAYFGRLVRDYLGRPGSRILTTALLALNGVVLLAYFIGLSTVLTDAFGARPELWAAMLFATLLFFLRRETLNATVASALVVGAASISLIVILSLIAIPHISEANLRHAQIPFRAGTPFESSVLELIFGVVLLAYFGHTSTANCAAVVLAREPSGRSLINGSVAALVAAMLLYALWVIAVGGVVSPAELADETGTSLAPLAEQLGSIVLVFGVTFSILAMGMASIHTALGLSNQVKEWLPAGSAERRPDVQTSVSSAGTRFLRLPELRAKQVHLIFGLLPTIAIFLVAEWLFLTNRESFSGLLGFIGVLTAPIIAGVFSMLLLYAARRKGDCDVGMAWRVLDQPIVMVITCGLFLASILVHGLFVWDDPFRRATGLAVSVILLWFLVSIQSSAFIPRAVVELRLGHERESAAELNLVSPGRFGPPIVKWLRNGRQPSGHERHAVGISGATVQTDPLPVRECKVWTHRLTPDGTSQGVGAQVRVANQRTAQVDEYQMPNGVVIFPFSGEAAVLSITLSNGKTSEDEEVENPQ